MNTGVTRLYTRLYYSGKLDDGSIVYSGVIGFMLSYDAKSASSAQSHCDVPPTFLINFQNLY